MWPWKRHSAETRLPESPPSLREAFSTLRADFEDLKTTVRALARDVDDLDETVRSLRGRATKREALAAREDPAAAPSEAGNDGKGRLRSVSATPDPSLTVAALKRAGRWPL